MAPQGSEANTGDGAGILTALPHAFFRKVATEQFKTDLPAAGFYAAGNVFLPQDAKERARVKEIVEQIIAEHGQQLIFWRVVPTDSSGANIGPTAKASEPVVEQLFVGSKPGITTEAFERQLYVIRKKASQKIRNDGNLKQGKMFYVCTLSTKVIVYKGMLAPNQVLPYYPDLSDPEYVTHLAMVHSRFSTNTFPSWDRAQPNRFMSHNGEINTVRGNQNWMSARQGVLNSSLFGEDLQSIFPVVEPDGSDSMTFDNVLELLFLTGRPLQESLTMLIPEAWQNDHLMDPQKRAYYEFNSCLMEPWDGPASIVFTDGKYIGAVLDRNGLRPSRYYLTKDQRVIMASEAGVLPVKPENVIAKGRLEPGKMFLVDFEQGRLIPDEELKQQFASQRPYAKWLKEQQLNVSDLRTSLEQKRYEPATLLPRAKAFGYTAETVQFMLTPMIMQKRDPIGSMGNDAALAVLSDKPRMIYDYFKQLFAQVTNPPIDSIREETIMSLECQIGPEQNILEISEKHAHRLRISHPILSNEQMAAIKHTGVRRWKARTIDMTWSKKEGAAGLETAISRLCQEAEEAVDRGYSLLVLSDRNVGPERLPVSALLAVGAVHHHLIKTRKRTRIGLLLETGEAREVHHHCLLVGYGADAINPYVAFEMLWYQLREGKIKDQADDDDALVEVYRKAAAKGILKVMAKMGISTLQSYKGAQIFEAVGLGPKVIDKCFVGTPSRISGVNFEILAQEVILRHAEAYPERENSPSRILGTDGQFHWRANGERHMYSPEAITLLQQSSQTNNVETYKKFSKLSNEDPKLRCTLRGLLDIKPSARTPIPVEEVEPTVQIVKRFRTGAMSFGSISKEAHESLAIAMNRLGGKSNTGEGGEDPKRFNNMPNGDSRRSAIKQVASGRFGVTSWYLSNADEIQIKMAQGAKPGEGGELPGHKVDRIIARTRYSTPGVGLISPPPHHDIYSIEDLAQLIHDLKNSNPSANISVKLVSEVGVGTIAAGVAKAHADHILISGHDGGTGASALTSIKHAGLPWELGLAETHQTLVMNNLRSRVRLETDGQLKTGRDIFVAACLGAEEFGFATAPLITMGCIMMRKCHLNTCPVGIATQNPELRKRFTGLPDNVVNYLFFVAEELREIMASLGFKSVNELIGRTDLLEANTADHWKAKHLDLSNFLKPAAKPSEDTPVSCCIPQDHDLESALDHVLIQQAKPALEKGEPVRIESRVVNTNRVVGTMLGHEVSKRYGEFGLPDDTIHVRLKGTAGQSLGAWLTRGITIELEGDANDYVGKGLSGGKLVIYPPQDSILSPGENVIIGNVGLYGATGGYAFFRGSAAERFAVRNSGARAVVEGVGDHACEYMTGGQVVVLGPTGRNFGAGMSGGIAYIWDREGDFAQKCNTGMVVLEDIETTEDIVSLRELITMHRELTGSTLAWYVLHNWGECLPQFVKVFPVDYKRVLAERIKHDEEMSANVHQDGVPA